MIGLYGRQWIPPQASDAFHPDLLNADELVFAGNPYAALKLYKSLAGQSHIAQRRLMLAQRRIKSILNRPDRTSLKQEYIIKLGFVDWYGDFNQHENFIIDLFNQAAIKSIATAPEEADIIVAGCYGSRIQQDATLSKDKLVLFVSGENLRPSYQIHDFSLSTEWRSYCRKNQRYPQWFNDLDFRGEDILCEFSQKGQEANTRPRDLPITAIYNNTTPLREEIIATLRQSFGHKNIHVFGSQRSGEVNKIEILARSVIHICLENSIGEGYVTEKLHHSLLMGCKSLYWGDISSKNDFQQTNVYNLYEKTDLHKMKEWCEIQLKSNTEIKQNCQYINESIYAQRPSIKPILKHIRRIATMITGWELLRGKI